MLFIDFLRTIAACLITNSHYTGIYPTDIIANGGLLGDVIFFAVSGYCLFNVKKSFPSWYGKRIFRIFPPVLIITTLYFVIGAYSFSEGKGFLWWFVFPTNYHFVASILLLYVLFYFVGRYEIVRKRIPLIALLVATVYLILYIFVYNKTYYHIDNVREYMIEFIFFESMLLGAYFRFNNDKYVNKFKWWLPIAVIVLFVVYFVSKLFFSRYPKYSEFQIVNQLVLFVLLYFVFRLFISIEEKLHKIPAWLKKIVSFLSKITLEIYVVQYVLIDVIRPLFGFPLNWFVLTSSILVAAFVLHFVTKYVTKGLEFIAFKIKNSIKKQEG